MKLLSVNFRCDMLKNLTCESSEDPLKHYTTVKSQTKKKYIKPKNKMTSVKTKKKQKATKKKILREILNV
jgi:hypothetical protein